MCASRASSWPPSAGRWSRTPANQCSTSAATCCCRPPPSPTPTSTRRSRPTEWPTPRATSSAPSWRGGRNGRRPPPTATPPRALTADRVANPTGDLLGAIVAWREYRPTLTLDDIAARAERAVRMLVANGVTAVRTHVDVAADIGTLGIEALVKAREAVAHLADIQIVALVSPPITGPDGGPNCRALDAAMAAGADLVGGVPHLEPDPRAAIAHVLDLAAATGRDVDLHMDETLDPGVLHLAELATMVAGFPQRVTASH